MTLIWFLFPFVCLFSLVQAKCLCPPGTYLTKRCHSPSSVSECEKCPEGTFNSDFNNASACRPCYLCDSGKEEVGKCTAIKNTECACPVSSYFKTDIHRCIACTKCSEGQFYVKACSTFSDSVCRDCPEGTFSVQLRNNCQRCSYCKEGQMVHQVCTLVSDTVCKTVIKSVKEVPTTSTASDLEQHPSQTSVLNRSSCRSSDALCPEPVVPEEFVWTLIGIVVLGTAILIAVPIWPLLTNKQKSTKVSSDVRKSKQKATITTAKSTSTIKETGLKFRDVSYDYTVNLGTLLNPKSEKNWKSLAASMGYNSSFVGNLELEPLEATASLLREWACGKNATVFRLYTLLKELGRDDAARVLLPLLENNGFNQQAEFV